MFIVCQLGVKFNLNICLFVSSELGECVGDVSSLIHRHNIVVLYDLLLLFLLVFLGWLYLGGKLFNDLW